jgi:uncharacterized protein YodC (DUF2158 family)
VSARVGDLVRLKCGGPLLLVVAHNPDAVTVLWFTTDGQLMEAELEQRWLEAA